MGQEGYVLQASASPLVEGEKLVSCNDFSDSTRKYLVVRKAEQAKTEPDDGRGWLRPFGVRFSQQTCPRPIEYHCFCSICLEQGIDSQIHLPPSLATCPTRHSSALSRSRSYRLFRCGKLRANRNELVSKQVRLALRRGCTAPDGADA